MKAILVGRIKKWIFFAVIGCSAYLVGYYWGHQEQAPVKTTERPQFFTPK